VPGVLEQVWPVFEAETREQIQALAAGVMDLEAGASDVAPLLRLAHTLKGTAASLGVLDVERVVHAVEDVLALARGGERLPPGAVEAVLRAASAVETSLSPAILGRIDQADRVVAELRAAHGGQASPARDGGGGGEAPSGDLAALASEIGALCRTDGAERAAHAARALAAADRLAAALPPEAAEIARRVARSAAEIRAGGAEDAVPRAIARAAADVVELRAAAARPPEAAPAARPKEAPDGAPRGGEERNVRIDAARLDSVAADVDQLVVGVARREGRGRDLLRLEQGLRESLRLLQRGLAEAGLGEDARPRPLSEGLERLASLGAELGRHVVEARRESDRERSVAHGLRGALRDLRMVPAQSALGPLRATVREVSAQLGKKVSLQLAGGEVRLDRRVLDELRAPLLHLVRNALDHGIETPEARRAAGKPPEAAVEVRVAALKDHVLITVRDDGAGLSPERLRAAAVQRGLVTAADAAQLSDADAAQLAFRAGLSTATEITSLSGRGVGLDVVGEAVRRLGGAVSVSFERGRGTSFVLEVPLTMSGATGLLFRAAGGLALLPADAVERVLLVEPRDVGTVAGRATVTVEGDEIPFSSVAQALGSGAGPPPAGLAVALLLAVGGKRVALAVDEVLGEHAIVVSSLGRRMSAVRAIAGAAVLGDGRVVSVLQPAHLVAASRPRAAGEGAARPRIVVADDSLATRAAAKAILEIAGFEVLPAADGEEALALVRDPGCELVVSDVQMPRLDGLGLTRRIKGDPRLARTPVILVTSLGTAEDRAAGLKAGADAYLVKREIQQGKLLELVRQLLPA
jgi:two-component system chemotaxis sensor kinase CheA